MAGGRPIGVERRGNGDARAATKVAVRAVRLSEPARASRRQAARRRADRRQEQVVTQWLRTLEAHSGPAPR